MRPTADFTVDLNFSSDSLGALAHNADAQMPRRNRLRIKTTPIIFYRQCHAYRIASEVNDNLAGQGVLGDIV